MSTLAPTSDEPPPVAAALPWAAAFTAYVVSLLKGWHPSSPENARAYLGDARNQHLQRANPRLPEGSLRALLTAAVIEWIRVLPTHPFDEAHAPFVERLAAAYVRAATALVSRHGEERMDLKAAEAAGAIVHEGAWEALARPSDVVRRLGGDKSIAALVGPRVRLDDDKAFLVEGERATYGLRGDALRLTNAPGRLLRDLLLGLGPRHSSRRADASNLREALARATSGQLTLTRGKTPLLTAELDVDGPTLELLRRSRRHG